MESLWTGLITIPIKLNTQQFNKLNFKKKKKGSHCIRRTLIMSTQRRENTVTYNQTRKETFYESIQMKQGKRATGKVKVYGYWIPHTYVDDISIQKKCCLTNLRYPHCHWH